MAPVVIDLTSSPEPEETSGKAARSALDSFKPRSQKGDLPKPTQDEQKHSAARTVLQHVHPANSNGKTLRQVLSAESPAAPPQGYGQQRNVVTANPYGLLLKRAHDALQASRAGYHTHPSNGHSPIPLSHPGSNAQPTLRSGSFATSDKPPPMQQAPFVPQVTKVSEVINLDDDSDAASSSSDSLLPIGAILEAELHGLRPFKKRRISAPAEDTHSGGNKLRSGTEERSTIDAPSSFRPRNAVALANTSTNGLPLRSTPPEVDGRHISADDRGETNQIEAIRARGLTIGIPFTVERISSEISDLLHSPGEQLSGSSSLEHESVRMRAETHFSSDQGEPEPLQKNGSMNVSSLEGPRNRGERYSVSTLSSSLSYDSSHSGAESSSKDGEESIRLPKMQLHGHSGIQQPTPTLGTATRRLVYTPTEDDLLIRMRKHNNLSCKDILPHFPARTMGSILGHYDELTVGPRDQQLRSGPAKTSILYSKAEDDLLLKLRDVDKLDWHNILPHFPSRAMGSIAGHYGQLKAKESQQTPKQTIPVHLTPKGSHKIAYSTEEDALLVNLKEVHDLNWDTIAPYFPGRTRIALQVRYSTKLKSESKNQQAASKSPSQQQNSSTNHGTWYSTEEDALIVRLRGEGLNWDQMTAHFKGRTAGSLAVRYSSKLKDKSARQSALDDDGAQQALTDDDSTTRHRPKRRHNGPSVLSGFISWADLKKAKQDLNKAKQRKLEDKRPATVDDPEKQEPVHSRSWHGTERAYPKSFARILRQREIGGTSRQSWFPASRSIPDELKEQVFDDLGPRKCLQGTSGDVTCLVWAPDGHRFAAGSVAISDDRSMQYNKPCNLLLGYAPDSVVYELPQHHIQRPINTDTGNVNSLHSMRETQDQRLFMTVGSVQFSPDGKTLYSAGMDGKARAYSVNSDKSASCQYELAHPTRVDLLSVSNLDILATACYEAADGCVRIYKGGNKFASLSPTRTDNQTERPMYPSALKWGTAWRHSHLLLAGFSIDSSDEERNLAGETCLWDVHHEKRIEVNAVTRNVFDAAWNPLPSSSSTTFAVASTPGVNKVNRGTRTVVQCFAPRQNRAAAVLEFEMRAFDINDVAYCPHDDNMIAAGATDGKVYVFDQRYAKKGHGPLHVLAHNHSLNVLDHDRKRELADTGVRFLSWGATSSRLYSGSSDGVVKVWNPYLSSNDAHIQDVANFTSAVMSGAFSPDYRDLLIGEDQGRINLFSVGHRDQSIRSMDRFELRQARTSNDASVEAYDGRIAARDLLESGQVELRPMGAFSKRQAVQGPDYHGPYLAPSTKELREAETEYQVALDLQNEEHAKAAVNYAKSSDIRQALRGADTRVQTAQERLIHLHSRLDDFESLKPQARAIQSQFKDAEEKHKASVASLSSGLEHCTLECNYLSINLGDNAEVPDSRRSEGRIPAVLWQKPASSTCEMEVEELIDCGLTQKCATCAKPAQRPRIGLPSCSSCTQKRDGITATCEICLSPVRPTLDTKLPNLCERCNFSCFRCGKPACIARDAAKISCYQCELVWTAGVLGYELATTCNASEPASRTRIAEVESMSDEETTG